MCFRSNPKAVVDLVTWKRKGEEGQPQYWFLCSACNEPMAQGLAAGGWVKARDGEPAECNACAQKCALHAKGLWGADEQTRLAECAACGFYEPCFFKGRHYC